MIRFRQRCSVNIGVLLLTSILSSAVGLENQCLLCTMDRVKGIWGNTSRESREYIPGWNSRVNRNFFILGRVSSRIQVNALWFIAKESCWLTCYIKLSKHFLKRVYGGFRYWWKCGDDLRSTHSLPLTQHCCFIEYGLYYILENEKTREIFLRKERGLTAEIGGQGNEIPIHFLYLWWWFLLFLLKILTKDFLYMLQSQVASWSPIIISVILHCVRFNFIQASFSFKFLFPSKWKDVCAVLMYPMIIVLAMDGIPFNSFSTNFTRVLVFRKASK